MQRLEAGWTKFTVMDGWNVAVQTRVARTEATRNQMARNGGNVFAGVTDNFQHPRRVRRRVMQGEFFATVAPLSLIIVAWSAFVMVGGLARFDLRQIVNGVQHSDGGFEIQLRSEQVFLRNQHARTVVVTNC